MRARKRFGQHFLVDESVLERLAALISPRADDLLLEIGPGHGALTGHLYGRVARYLSIVRLDGMGDLPGPDERVRAELAALAPAERRARLERADPEEEAEDEKVKLVELHQ